MAAAQPDTPGSTPRIEEHQSRAQYDQNGRGTDIGQEDAHSDQGYDRPDQTVFDLTMDYSDDDTLLDWEQYAGMRKFRCWGMDCSLVARFCPFMPWVPPEWWYRYSRRQRKLITMGFSIFGALLLLLVGAIVLLSLLPTQDIPQGLGYGESVECTWSDYHLPRSMLPSQYDLELQVQLEEPFTVTGAVEIHLNVTKPSRCVVLHAVAMNITHMNRLDPHTHGQWRQNGETDQLILEFEDLLTPPAARVAMLFNYTLSQGLSGFYRSNYTAGSRGSQIMGTTQFEANGARKAFPCFDEPALKARWNLTLTAPSGQTALFNMPQASSKAAGDGLTMHSYEVTPPMSSYLVAFIVGNLTSISGTVPYPQGAGQERTVSIWGTPDRAESLQAALQVATKVLPAYEQLLGVPYALPKLDLVAIPDFAAGAMENWGLITYRETDLLIDANHSSLANERRVAVVIAHEMAHLWFGDLVTMRDWGELWLNEGFATYFENVGASIARPDLVYFETFYSDFVTTALAIDAKPKSTHPLATLTGMDTDEKVEAMFDGISYDKGGSVLRMLRAYLERNTDPQPLLRRSLLQAAGEEPFLTGLQAYLRKYSYSNVTSDRLWAELGAATGEDVPSWMQAWTFQPGAPRVEVLLDGPLNRDVKVYQAPFAFEGVRTCDDSKHGRDQGNAPWWIPVATVTRNTSTPSWQTFSKCLMDQPIYVLQDDNDWVKLNAQQHGLYRVNYPVSLWANLATAAATPTAANTPPAISAVDLAGLLDDAFALSAAGETHIESFLELTRALPHRQAAEYAPWSVAADYLITISRRLQSFKPQPDCAERWASYVRMNVTSLFLAGQTELALNASLAATTSDTQARLLRPLLLALAGEFNDTGVRQEAMELFAAPGAQAAGQDLDIRGMMYSIVVASGQQADYDAMKQLYLAAQNANEKSRTLAALAYSPSPALINATLEYAISDSVRSQDTSSLILRVAGRGGPALTAAWDFVQTRYNDISVKLGGIEEAANQMGKLLSNVAARLAEPSAMEQVDAVFDAHKDVLTEPRFREAAKEGIRANLDWVQKNAGPACDWLQRLQE